MYVYTQPLSQVQNATQGQFLYGVQLVWIQILPSTILSAVPKLKSPVCQEGRIYEFLGTFAQSKSKTASSKIGLPRPFPTIITVTPCAHLGEGSMELANFTP